MKQKYTFNEYFKTAGWSFKLAWQIDKGMLIVWMLMSIGFSVLPAVILGLNRNVVKIITDYIRLGTGNFQQVFWPVILLGIVMTGVSLTSRFNSDFMGNYMYDSYCLGMQECMLDTVQKVPMKDFLQKDFNDDYIFIGTKYYSLVDFISTICEISGKLSSIISLLIVALSVSAIIFFISLGYIIISVTISAFYGRPEENEWSKARQMVRLADYYAELAMSSSVGKETRVYESEKYMLDQFRTAYGFVERYEKGYAFKTEKYSFLLGLTFYLFSAVIIIYSIYRVSSGSMGPDVFLMVYALCTSIHKGLDGLSHSMFHISYTLYNLLRIRRFILRAHEFIADCKNPEPDPSDQKIVFEARNLCFSYDGEKQVLSNLNFKIMQGEVVALVGQNGCGKTTLAHLLLGLYPPTSGELLFYGKPLSDYSMEFLSSHIGAFFQQIYLFHMRLRENVGFGDIKEIENRCKILEAIGKGGAMKILENFSGNLETLLLKEIDKSGFELSGGEQQKVAVSRAHMSNKEILIFDEPASRLDPIAEMEQFMNIKEKIEGRSAILISHRVSFARLASRIFVLKNGALIEDASHEELLEKGGEYASFFKDQAEWYQQECGAAAAEL